MGTGGGQQREACRSVVRCAKQTARRLLLGKKRALVVRGTGIGVYAQAAWLEAMLLRNRHRKQRAVARGVS